MSDTRTPHDPGSHWDSRYEQFGAGGVAWFQPHAEVSLELIEAAGVGPSTPVVDVGGGSSRLVDDLLARGFDDITVLDVSRAALELTRQRLGHTEHVELVHADLLTWQPARRWGLWHDRAVFHFFTEAAERAIYLDRLSTALEFGGVFVLGTFASDAPDHCSGLPVNRYDPDSLATTIRAAIPGVVIQATRRETHTTPAGARQPFTWIVGSVP